MAIDFEEEEKLQWKFIIPIALLVVALGLTVWSCMGQKAEIKNLAQDLSLTSYELEKYKKLYVESTSDSRGSENTTEDIARLLQECNTQNNEMQDQLNALLLGEEANVVNTQQ